VTTYILPGENQIKAKLEARGVARAQTLADLTAFLSGITEPDADVPVEPWEQREAEG